MNYTDAIAKFFAANADKDAVTLNPILWANGYEAIDPGQLDVDASGYLTYRGKRMNGPAIDLPLVIDAPGFWLGELISDGSTPFLVDPNDPPHALLAPFTYGNGQISGQVIGADNATFIAALIPLLTKLRDSALVPADEVDKAIKLCKAGVLCMPGNAAECQNLYHQAFPSLPTQPVFPAAYTKAGTTAWAGVAQAFHDAKTAWLGKSYATAADLAKAAAANVDLWNTVYSAVETVAAPAILLGLAPASDNYSSLLGLKWYQLLPLLAIAGIVGYALVKRGSAQAAAKLIPA